MTQRLKLVRERVDAILQRFLAEKRAKFGGSEPDLSKLIAAAEALTLRGGKRLRPSFTVAGHLAIAPIDDLEAVAAAGAAFELLQTFLLIQDDWMDKDDVRRGGPSVHAMIRAEIKDEHRAASIAIIASDLSCAWSFEILAAAAFAPERVRRGLALLASAVEEVALGQYLDVTGSTAVETVHLLKTAGYTVRWPLRLGAILAGAEAAELEALDRVALPLGIAFQLRDDLLGTFGDTSVTGKPSASDLREGKETAIIADARSSLKTDEWRAVAMVLGKPVAAEGDIAAAKEALERGGVRARIEERIDAKLREATEALERASIRGEGVAAIGALAEMIAAPSP